MEHTKGKWIVKAPPGFEYLKDTFYITVEGDVNKLIAVAAGDKTPPSDGGDFVTIEEGKANARLIAAAPETKKQRDDLLAACKTMVSYIEANDWEAEFADPMPSILQAIAKIENAQDAPGRK